VTDYANYWCSLEETGRVVEEFIEDLNFEQTLNVRVDFIVFTVKGLPVGHEKIPIVILFSLHYLGGF
jgi:hypothetical protein